VATFIIMAQQRQVKPQGLCMVVNAGEASMLVPPLLIMTDGGDQQLSASRRAPFTVNFDHGIQSQ
jgi:hypothetical protein